MNRIKKLIDIIAILSFALIVLTWFKENLLISGGDFDFPLSPDYSLERHLMLWDDKLDGGYYSARNIIQFPYQFLVFSMFKTGIPLIFIQRVLLFILFAASGVSMYYLSNFIFRYPPNRISCLASSIFYMANPFHSTFTWAQLNLNIFLFPFLPILILFYFRNINFPSVKNIFGIGTVFFLMTPAFSNPVLVAVPFIPIFIFYVYFYALNSKEKEKIQNLKITTVMTVVVFIFLNIWWLLPLLGGIYDEYRAASQASLGFSNIEVLKLNSRDTSFANIFRLLGHWALNGYFCGDPYYKWADVYKSNWMQFLGFLLPITIFLSLIFRNKNLYPIFFAILAVSSLFMVKGVHPPLEALSYWIYSRIPFMDAFRNQYEKFGILIVFGYSVLLGFSMNYLIYFCLSGIRKKRFILLMAFLLGIIGSIAVYCLYPFFSGKVIYDGGKILRSYHVEIPEYYDEAGRWVERAIGNYRLLEIPLTNLYGVMLKWPKGYQGANPTWRILKIPSCFAVYRNPLLFSLDKKIKNNEDINLNRIGGLLSVKYILFHGDIDEKYSNVELKRIAKNLRSKEGSKLDKSFGPLDFLRIKEEELLPRIYATKKPVFVYKDVASLFGLSLSDFWEEFPAFIFLNRQKDYSLFPKISELDILKKGVEVGYFRKILLVNSGFEDLCKSIRAQENDWKSNEKEVAQKEKKEISPKELVGYFYFIDKVDDLHRSEDMLENIRFERGNLFKIGKKEIYIPREGNYIFKVMIKPNRDFLERDFVSNISSTMKPSLEAVSGWNIKALNTSYNHSLSEEGLHISAYFQKKGDVKEELVLTKNFPGVSIYERPYLALSVSMEEAGTQEVEVDVWFTDPNSLLFKNKNLNFKANNKLHLVDLYEMAKSKWQNIKGDINNLYVNEVVLKFKKKDGMDLSAEKRKKIYTFLFKNISFLKTKPILAEFRDDLMGYLPDYYYYFDGSGEIKGVDFIEQVPWDIKDVYKLDIKRFIDLKESPVLSLKFQRPIIEESMDAARKGYPSEWKLTLGIDFDGDEKEDKKIEMLSPPSAQIDGKIFLNIPAYDVVKKRFPNKKAYNLLWVGISHPEDNEILYQTVATKKLVRYREHIYKLSDARKGSNVLEVDGKIHKLPAMSGDDERKWVEFKNIYLKKGDHTLNVFENDRFKVEMVEIQPEAWGKGLEVRGYERPETKFKKINPTRYLVDVIGAKGPFTLVFSESFHEGWKAYIRKGSGVRGQGSEGKDEPWSALWSAWKDRGKRIEIKDHFVVNGYANGWIVPVNKEMAKENIEIVLEFKPQRLFEIGVLISAIAMLLCITYLTYSWVRGRK